MPQIDTNNRKTIYGYIFGNISIKSIFTNCRNKKNQIYKGKTNKISVSRNQLFFLRQKQFRCADIDARLITEPSSPKNPLKYFRQLSR